MRLRDNKGGAEVIDNNNLRLTVCEGLKKYLGIPIIRSGQNAEPPDYPYLSYTVTTLESANNGTWGEYKDGIDRIPVTQTWSITVQSDKEAESTELAGKAREYFDNVGTQYLNDRDVIVQSVTNITNRNNLISIDYEYRNGFDVSFYLFSEERKLLEPDGTEETIRKIILMGTNGEGETTK